MAQMRDVCSEPLRNRPDRFAGARFNLLPVEFEDDARCCRFSVAAAHLLYSAAAGLGSGNSSGKYLTTLVSGLEAAWPRPQIEASRMHCDNSFNNAVSQTFCSISRRAFCVPARQGVH